MSFAQLHYSVIKSYFSNPICFEPYNTQLFYGSKFFICFVFKFNSNNISITSAILFSIFKHQNHVMETVARITGNLDESRD